MTEQERYKDLYDKYKDLEKSLDGAGVFGEIMEKALDLACNHIRNSELETGARTSYEWRLVFTTNAQEILEAAANLPMVTVTGVKEKTNDDDN